MEWLGAMFKGIGDTFTAGSTAHQGLMNERNIQRQLAFGREQLDAQAQQGLMAFIMGKQSQQTQVVITILVAVIILVAIIFIFRKRKA